MSFLDLFRELVGKDDLADLMLIDFSWASDLASLALCRINMVCIRWIENWFTERSQNIVFNGQISLGLFLAGFPSNLFLINAI